MKFFLTNASVENQCNVSNSAKLMFYKFLWFNSEAGLFITFLHFEEGKHISTIQKSESFARIICTEWRQRVRTVNVTRSKVKPMKTFPYCVKFKASDVTNYKIHSEKKTVWVNLRRFIMSFHLLSNMKMWYFNCYFFFFGYGGYFICS